ncbi:hypothetical protein [Pseudomonas oryzihabitans]|uniref:Uncharacterized protein n=1 Tax=Pseudomonas oryzihabitans TaxID=47885 RepID=A0AAJ2EW90_9PSED|nr:hypothetical protein [Pseudomonas psychrotolerans]MDR6234507.1 hypothetical protein [Pseudomonas psychrotolerans]MDR6356358.1 hypothetical protein [Pseudomonas psychrotolerans]
MNTKKAKAAASLILALLCNSSLAKNQPTYIESSLCLQKERIILSFKTAQKKKLASICAGPENSYLVYRYGNQDSVELTYPKAQDSESWKNFSFSSYTRAAGESNDPKGNYEIVFTNNNTEYSIYQDWGSKSDYEVGIIINDKGKNYKILGISKSQTGSLSRLESFKDLLANQQ